MAVVDAYLRTLDTPHREALARIRDIIYTIAPDVEERKSYGMPAFYLHKKYLAGFFVFKDHMSFFPGSIEQFEDDLRDFATSKGTIQFSPEHQIPEAVIQKIVSARIAAITSS